MTSSSLTLPLAFLAGFLSFISPCVLPLVPVYLGYLTGSVVTEESSPPRGTTFSHALLFVAGFSLIFVLVFGAPVGLLGQMMVRLTPLLVKVGGGWLILFGLHTTGVVRIPILSAEGRLDWGAKRDPSYLRSLLMGMTFAAGWTPCVGPLLGAILTLALDAQSLVRALLFLTAYSAGLGLPFLAAALLLTVVVERLRRWNRYLRIVSLVSGVFLIVVGLLLVTDAFQRFTALLSGAAPDWLWERL
jgi:cytochrome c-type biogenesis protein